MCDTIRIYDEICEEYARKTESIVLKELWDMFACRIPERGKILDLGCGSGRDSIYFRSIGFEIVALDASPKMCQIAYRYLKDNVVCGNILDLCYDREFDGIWACASMLHIPRKDQQLAWKTIVKALRQNGYAYVSYKYGGFEGRRNRLYYLDMTEERLMEMLDKIDQLQVEKVWKTIDIHYEDKKPEIWLHCLVRRIS